MGHLIEFTGGAKPATVQVAEELHGVIAAWTSAIADHLRSPSLVMSPLRLKREPVALPEHDGQWFEAPRRAERLGELLNVLATVVRTADALQHLAGSAGGTVLACNPTTSDVGHDVEVVGDDGSHWIVEVSDVAGRGNANGKMTKDLMTLLETPPEARLLMAVSPTSAGWLTNPRTSTTSRLGVRCRSVATIGDAPDVATNIIVVERAFETQP